MIYNMDFLIAALVFLLLILGHCMDFRRMDVQKNRTFAIFMLIGIADILFDLICTLMISWESPRLAWLLRMCLMALYLLQVLVPYVLQRHMLVQYRIRNGRRAMILWSLYPALMVLMVLVNPWTKLLYTVNEGGKYIRGPLYMSMYFYAMVYILSIAFVAIRHTQEIGRSRVLALWELILFSGACVVVQSIYNDLLMTGFGIALGITVLFFTMNNPYQNTDHLTGAFGVNYLHERMQDLLVRKREFHLVTVELQMKRVNLSYGARAGDRLLIQTAQMLRSINRRNLIFRVSGQRFLILAFSIVDYDAAITQVQRRFSAPVTVDGGQLYCPVMICGIPHGERFGDSTVLLEYLNYLAQLTPPGTQTAVVQDNEETRKGFRYEQSIESYLARALEEDSFEICFQPVYSLRSGKCVSLETLSRMRHPTLGPVSPDVFIRVAEKNDMIARFDLLQLRRACCFLSAHPEVVEQIETVKFNLSPIELMKRGHAQNLIDIIREYGLPPELFQFEITETVASEDSESMSEAVQCFVKAGIGLCLDDFGSGFANLNTVLKQPFSTIKLDRSLLMGICEDVKVAAFYQNIVTMFQNMGYAVIAEGIEEKEELELIRHWGVDLVQGYYFSHPLTQQALVEKMCAQKNAS